MDSKKTIKIKLKKALFFSLRVLVIFIVIGLISRFTLVGWIENKFIKEYVPSLLSVIICLYVESKYFTDNE